MNLCKINEKRNIYKWIISIGLIVLFLFFIDVFVINKTLLTPYEELHPTSLPTKDIKTGIYYLTDKDTDKTYTLDKNRSLVYYDKQNGKIKPLGDESQRIKLTSRGLVYLRPPVSPFYAFYVPRLSFRLLLPAILIISFLFLLFRFIEIPNDKQGVKLFLLFLFTIFIRASFAWLRHDFNQMGTELLRYSGESVLFDVPRITNVFEFLKNYPEKMITLSMNGSHYPPGYALLLKLITTISGSSTMGCIKANINTIGWTLIIIGSTSIYPLYLTAKELFNKKTAITAVIIFIFAPNTTIYGAVSLDAIFVVLALWPIYFLMKANKDKKVFLYSALAGLSLGLAVFFSFTGIPVGLLMAIFILLQMVQSKENFYQYFEIACFAAIGFFSFVIFLHIAFGFNLIQCFLNAKELEMLFMNKVVAKYHDKSLSDLSSYITWGNYLAFAVYAGFHNIALFLRNVKSSVRNGIKNLNNTKIFSIAVFVFIVIIGTSFVYHMETERIWQFVTAFIAIIIAGELCEIQSASLKKHVLLLILSISAISTIILESLFFTLW
jgi:Dolichyl-phosphate-mannose-protein mannosyltransferase